MFPGYVETSKTKTKNTSFPKKINQNNIKKYLSSKQTKRQVKTVAL